ncbi:glycoside hydrolase family protein [Nitritalea halalkaliphila LW7]|uniref:beta-N-acetylhexosaminidase n=1 Tax=Nitritalea halalkaliphila LW7 TaxID=1189621 RepID=I5BW48_9BACT|nr:glycoside hydrolase family 3 N-terminal domain-containing protein [Nitritalea halalkaliphila]EIM73800.1 glycoside hydrolase family protein [Nitritalea halalkaliphila LW7]
MYNPSHLSLEEKIAQAFSPAAFIHESDQHVREIERLIVEQKIGGLTFFHSKRSAAANYDRKTEFVKLESTLSRLQELIQHYQSLARTPLLINMDAEWGLAMRVEDTPAYPFAISLGAVQQNAEQAVFQIGRQMAQDLKGVGIHLNLAPVADINDNPLNPVIGYRSFGAEKNRVSRLALAFYKGMRSEGVAGCYKHFPGHGNTAVDSHLGLPILLQQERELWENELVPFQEGIDAGIGMIMIGTWRSPALTGGSTLPATVSREIITGLLRQRMGFTGVVISDALNMQAVASLYPTKGQLEREAYAAGTDILCYSEHVEAGISAIARDVASSHIEDSFGRVWALKGSLGLFQGCEPQFLNPSDAYSLNRGLAPKILTRVFEKEEGKTLKSARDRRTLLKVNLFGDPDPVFFQKIGATYSGDVLAVRTVEEVEQLKEKAAAYDTLLIACYPPSMRPSLDFGMDETVLEALLPLVAIKQCVLYFFGTPFALKRLRFLPLVQNVLLAYQAEAPFQESAAAVLLGYEKALGKLPLPLEDLIPLPIRS